MRADDGAYGDAFGRHLALDGETALIAANHDNDNGFNSGSAYLFDLQCENATCLADVTGDGVINVLDLIEVLLCFGQPAVPACQPEDINEDGTVDVLDLIALLLAFGTACP